MFLCGWLSDCMFQPGGLYGKVESGFGQQAWVCPNWPQLKHLILQKSRPDRNGGRYPWPGVKGALGDPDDWRVLSSRRAIGRISSPIFRARANMCCNKGGTVESEILWPVHWGRSAIVNMSSDSLSSSTAKTCSAGRWMFVEMLRQAKSVQTSIKVCSFRSF